MYIIFLKNCILVLYKTIICIYIFLVKVNNIIGDIMFKRLLLFFVFIFIFSSFMINRSKDMPVFLEDGGDVYIYHFYYDDLTTKNILEELSFLKDDDVMVHLYSNIDEKVVRYNFSSSDIKNKIGDYFDYYLSMLDNQNDIDRIYLKGIKINEIIIKMPENLANKYLNSKTGIKYEIFEE